MRTQESRAPPVVGRERRGLRQAASLSRSGRSTPFIAAGEPCEQSYVTEWEHARRVQPQSTRPAAGPIPRRRRRDRRLCSQNLFHHTGPFAMITAWWVSPLGDLARQRRQVLLCARTAAMRALAGPDNPSTARACERGPSASCSRRYRARRTSKPVPDAVTSVIATPSHFYSSAHLHLTPRGPPRQSSPRGAGRYRAPRVLPAQQAGGSWANGGGDLARGARETRQLGYPFRSHSESSSCCTRAALWDSTRAGALRAEPTPIPSVNVVDDVTTPRRSLRRLRTLAR